MRISGRGPGDVVCFPAGPEDAHQARTATVTATEDEEGFPRADDLRREEWLIAFEGEVTIRTPEGEAPVRVAIVSTKNEFGIVEYPEGGQVGIWAGETHYMLSR
jgi:hypothetical protein